MQKARIVSGIIIVIALLAGFFVFSPNSLGTGTNFKLGLDLAGGTHLSYKADVSDVNEGSVDEAMTALRDLIETRTNIFGVGEPIVQVEKAGRFSGREEYRLIVELPGVTDIKEAVNIIGKTPSLEFRLVPEDLSIDSIVTYDSTINTGLTGRLLKPGGARLQFAQGAVGGSAGGGVFVIVEFNEEGARLFGEITRENIGRQLAIFLDGNLESAPVIQEEIDNGTASISGNFAPEEGRELVRDLNLGALPVPIELIGTQSIGPTLGTEILEAGKRAGIFGLALVILFLIFWYKLPGVIASLSLIIYIILMLSVFKLLSITLTAAGIAGFILSIGMAVDANVLIFERIKEELRGERSLEDSIRDGFSRAWLSIRDSNLSSIITAVVLFYLSTSLVKGFALVFGVGVIFSMLTAISVSRTFLLSVANNRNIKLFKVGFGKN